MKIITSKLTLLIILSTIIVVSSLTTPQNSMAAATVDTTVDENSVSLHPISAQDLDTTSGSNQYASKMTDVLTASFTNILDTQIYTGLDKITN